MADHNHVEEKESPSEGKEVDSNLEWILQEKPSLETNTMDFLLSIGWDVKYCSAFYGSADIETRKRINTFIKERKKVVFQQQRGLECRFKNYLIRSTSYQEVSLLRLKNVKEIIGKHGFMYRDVGYKTLGHFVNTLKQYGVIGFKVGGSEWLMRQKGVQEKLTKYGLESTYQFE